jgi:hypothetical protein
LAALIGFLPASRAAQPVRAVLGNTVISRRDPAVAIKLPDSVHYVGTDRFILSDRNLGKFDQCELYSFVDSDSSHHIRKFYWIQFEAYLPSRPHLHHAYDSPRHVTIAGLDFYVDTWVSAASKPPEPGSDEAHFYALLASHGYRRNDFMYVRLVHLTDATKRKELMIIYAESLAGSGYTAAQLDKGGAQHVRWAAIENALIRRGEQSVTMRAIEDPSKSPHHRI